MTMSEKHQICVCDAIKNGTKLLITITTCTKHKPNIEIKKEPRKSSGQSDSAKPEEKNTQVVSKDVIPSSDESQHIVAEVEGSAVKEELLQEETAEPPQHGNGVVVSEEAAEQVSPVVDGLNEEMSQMSVREEEKLEASTVEHGASEEKEASLHEHESKEHASTNDNEEQKDPSIIENAHEYSTLGNEEKIHADENEEHAFSHEVNQEKTPTAIGDEQHKDKTDTSVDNGSSGEQDKYEKDEHDKTDISSVENVSSEEHDKTNVSTGDEHNHEEHVATNTDSEEKEEGEHEETHVFTGDEHKHEEHVATNTEGNQYDKTLVPTDDAEHVATNIEEDEHDKTLVTSANEHVSTNTEENEHDKTLVSTDDVEHEEQVATNTEENQHEKTLVSTDDAENVATNTEENEHDKTLVPTDDAEHVATNTEEDEHDKTLVTSADEHVSTNTEENEHDKTLVSTDDAEHVPTNTEEDEHDKTLVSTDDAEHVSTNTEKNEHDKTLVEVAEHNVSTNTKSSENNGGTGEQESHIDNEETNDPEEPHPVVMRVETAVNTMPLAQKTMAMNTIPFLDNLFSSQTYVPLDNNKDDCTVELFLFEKHSKRHGRNLSTKDTIVEGNVIFEGIGRISFPSYFDHESKVKAQTTHASPKSLGHFKRIFESVEQHLKPEDHLAKRYQKLIKMEPEALEEVHIPRDESVQITVPHVPRTPKWYDTFLVCFGLKANDDEYMSPSLPRVPEEKSYSVTRYLKV